MLYAFLVGGNVHPEWDDSSEKQALGFNDVKTGLKLVPSDQNDNALLSPWSSSKTKLFQKESSLKSLHLKPIVPHVGLISEGGKELTEKRLTW